MSGEGGEGATQPGPGRDDGPADRIRPRHDLAEQTDHDEISQAFRDHRQQTERHIERLEEVCEMIGEPPEEEECEGIKGLIEEHEEFVAMDPSPAVMAISLPKLRLRSMTPTLRAGHGLRPRRSRSVEAKERIVPDAG